MVAVEELGRGARADVRARKHLFRGGDVSVRAVRRALRRAAQHAHRALRVLLVARVCFVTSRPTGSGGSCRARCCAYASRWCTGTPPTAGATWTGTTKHARRPRLSRG